MQEMNAIDAHGFEDLAEAWLAGETYAAFVDACADVVSAFEAAEPWTNFYEAIDRCDVDMRALLSAIRLRDFSRPLDALCERGACGAFELTVRLLSCIEQEFEPAERESWVGAYLTFKLSNESVGDGSTTQTL